MKPSDIYKSAAPSVANIVIKQNGQRVSSGTGFLVNNHLVTCAHVIDVPNTCQIDVIFEKAQSPQTPSWSFSSRSALSLKGYSAEHSYDYAIVEPPAGVTLGPSLKFAEAVPDVGTEVCGLGYPFDDPHLTISAGLLSARFQSGPATMLKLDMSVNPSNSGGPLVLRDTGEVLGVIARKATGLTTAFDQLLKSFDDNIALLQARTTGGGIAIMGVDPIKALISSQQQMKMVSMEIKRSANVGIAYAVWHDPLSKEPVL